MKMSYLTNLYVDVLYARVTLDILYNDSHFDRIASGRQRLVVRFDPMIQVSLHTCMYVHSLVCVPFGI